MDHPIALVLFVVAAWWSSTGAILLLGRLPVRTYRWSLIGAAGIMLAAAWGLRWSTVHESLTGACVGFGSAVLIWGWLEISFLLGALTGPRRHACAPGCDGRSHFWHAVQSILYHELVTLVALALIFAVSWRAPDTYGLWTFVLLWIMRLSAKLNLHFGVPNVGEAMLPQHLKYLASFFRQGPMNSGFLLSLTTVGVLSGILIYAAWRMRFVALHGTGLTLLATLSTLAFIEHVMLALSVPADSFWNWRRRRGGAGSRNLPASDLSQAMAVDPGL